jgi:2-succinyl-5-enolpyruvyl-6-hydroxy-3-cyclohexene-1-carboxylate synthase
MSIPLRRGGDPTAPNPSTAQARVLLDELARCGLRHVVLCPGSRSTALAVAAHDHPRLLLHVELDERSAGYLAVGIGRATGVPAAVIVTSGTAVVNLHPAVVEADHDRVPLLLLTADRPPELHGVGANQTIEQHGVFASSPRWVVDLGVAGDDHEEVARWRWTASRAFGIAVGSPVEVPDVVSLDAWQAPGPVHLDIPFREPTVPVSDDGRSVATPFVHPLDGRPNGAPWATSDVEPYVSASHVLHALATRLAAVERGLVVVGGAIPTGVGPLLALARALGWPVIAEPHAPIAGGPDIGPDGGLLAHGTLLLGTASFASGHRPDLVLRVGRLTVAREVGALLETVPEVVVIDAHGGWVDHEDERVTLVRGAVGPTIAALHSMGGSGASPGPDGAWSEAWRDADAAVGAVLDATLGDPDATASEPAIARALAAGLPAGATLVVGSSMPIRDLDLVAVPRADVRVLANRGASGIDGVVSTALGAALASDGPTVALVGDLTLLHDAGAWLLREDPAGAQGDLVVVVVDNDGGGIFSFLPQRTHVAAFERLFATPHGIDLAHLAALHHLGYAVPATIGEVAAAVRAGIDAGGRHLVHVRTDRAANVDLHAALRSAVADALA